MQETPEPQSQTPFAQAVEAADPFLVAQEQPVSAEDQAITIEWTASEFIVHEKTMVWHLAVVAGAVVIAALLYVVLRDTVVSVVLVMAGLLLSFYGGRKPGQVQYVLNEQGVHVGPKHYEYSLFQSFSVMPEGAFSTIVFMPLKRFGLPITIYYAPEDEDAILAVLLEQLPLEKHKLTVTDKLMHRIRF